jgi:hypothetical protein
MESADASVILFRYVAKKQAIPTSPRNTISVPNYLWSMLLLKSPLTRSMATEKFKFLWFK